MERRKLLIDALEVDSFVVGPAPPQSGTVHAHADALPVGDAADVPAPPPKYTEEGYPAFTCTGGFACTLPGVCTCPESCDPMACSYDARCAGEV